MIMRSRSAFKVWYRSVFGPYAMPPGGFKAAWIRERNGEDVMSEAPVSTSSVKKDPFERFFASIGLNNAGKQTGVSAKTSSRAEAREEAEKMLIGNNNIATVAIAEVFEFAARTQPPVGFLNAKPIGAPPETAKPEMPQSQQRPMDSLKPRLGLPINRFGDER